MSAKVVLKASSLLLAFAMFTAACGDDDDSEVGDGDTTTTTESAEVDLSFGGLLWDNGPCDPALDPYKVGIIAVFESPVLSLIDQVDALDVSIERFNQRGGVGGHCMELEACDDQADPASSQSCARQFEREGVHVTINDTAAASNEVTAILEEAGIPRLVVNAQQAELNSPLSYPLGAGSVGTVSLMIPPLARDGVTDIYAIFPGLAGAADALLGLMGGMLDAYGADIVGNSSIAAGTTDFQQFILAAEESGAPGVILPLGENEALQVLGACQQLACDQRFSTALNSMSRENARDFAFAENIMWNGPLPPVTASQERWPVLEAIIADLESSGEPKLEADRVKTAPLQSWIGVALLVKIVEEFGDPDDVSREGIVAALDAAEAVDTWDLTPPWTPSASVSELFSRVSNPWYYQVGWDPDEENFVVADELLHITNELAGNIDYPQP